jgi:hypothetical protein
METILWCWDSRMTWDNEPDVTASSVAVSNRAFPYPKRPESFRTGFERLIDMCARVGIRGVIIWGFLRDAHGGIDTARDLCSFAADHGVEIYPGVGLCGYGGYYFDGDHPFNLGTYLRQHPERATEAFDAGSGKTIGPILDPSDPENHRWWREGLDWMLDTFAIGGINFEMGDHLVHPSSGAQKARAALNLQCQESLQDTVVATHDLIRHALSSKPDGVFINSTYLSYGSVKGFPRLEYISRLPAETVWQYSMAQEVSTPNFPDALHGAPPHRRYAYLHWGRAGGGDMRENYVNRIARVYPGLSSLDFEFVGAYGEVSPAVYAGANRNYRAMAAWAKNPALSRVEFDSSIPP